MNDLELVIQELERATTLAQQNPSRVDPVELAQTALRLARALSAASEELLPLRAFIADVDAFFDGADGDLFQRDHNCTPQRRVADFYEHFWKPSANERGYQRARKTYGRGRG